MLVTELGRFLVFTSPAPRAVIRSQPGASNPGGESASSAPSSYPAARRRATQNLNIDVPAASVAWAPEEQERDSGHDRSSATALTAQDNALLRLAGAQNIFALTSEKDLSELLSMVQHAGRLLVVDYYAPWCRACRRLLRQIDGLARSERFREVMFATVDFEQNREFCKAKKLEKLPTLEIYRGDHLSQRWSGASKQKLLDRLSDEMEATEEENAEKNEEGVGEHATKIEMHEQAHA